MIYVDLGYDPGGPGSQPSFPLQDPPVKTLFWPHKVAQQ